MNVHCQLIKTFNVNTWKTSHEAKFCPARRKHSTSSACVNVHYPLIKTFNVNTWTTSHEAKLVLHKEIIYLLLRGSSSLSYLAPLSHSFRIAALSRRILLIWLFPQLTAAAILQQYSLVLAKYLVCISVGNERTYSDKRPGDSATSAIITMLHHTSVRSLGTQNGVTQCDLGEFTRIVTSMKTRNSAANQLFLYRSWLCCEASTRFA